MARVARFKVFGASRFHHKNEVTIEIDRNNSFVKVRPKHSKRSYEARLQDVADHVIWINIKAALEEKKRAKKKRI